MSILDFAKDQYFHEADRRDKLSASASIPIGIATFIGTVISGSSQLIGQPINAIDIASIVFLGVSFAIICYFIFNTFRFFRGYDYRYIGGACQTAKYHQDLKDFLATHPSDGAISDEFETYLVQDYCSSAEHNMGNNDQKSYRLHEMNKAVLWALLPCIVGAALASLGDRFDPQSITKVEIMSGNGERSSAPPPPPSPAPSPQRPSPPPQRVIKEDQQPPQKR